MAPLNEDDSSEVEPEAGDGMVFEDEQPIALQVPRLLRVNDCTQDPGLAPNESLWPDPGKAQMQFIEGPDEPEVELIAGVDCGERLEVLLSELAHPAVIEMSGYAAVSEIAEMYDNPPVSVTCTAENNFAGCLVRQGPDGTSITFDVSASVIVLYVNWGIQVDVAQVVDNGRASASWAFQMQP